MSSSQDRSGVSLVPRQARPTSGSKTADGHACMREFLVIIPGVIIEASVS